MHAVLFTQDISQCTTLLAGLKNENIFSEVVTPDNNRHKMHLYSTSSVFIFHRELTVDDRTFLNLCRVVKPASTMVLLDPADSEAFDLMDLVFVRPFSFALIALHVQKKLLEKRDRLCPKELSLGTLRLHLEQRLLSKGSTVIHLKNLEFLLLQFFFLNEGKILSRSDLLEYVWDRNISLSTNTVDVHISRLRDKLEMCEADKHLRTIPCVGYMWVSDVMS